MKTNLLSLFVLFQLFPLIGAAQLFPVLVKDINPTGSGQPLGMTALGNKIVFMAEDGTNGIEPWISDGTEAGTFMIKDINPGAANSMEIGGVGATDYFIKRGNDLFFKANDGINGKELWITDGTETGTRMVKDINPGGLYTVQYFMLFNERLYFSAKDTAAASFETRMWVSDGTEAGTYQFADISPRVFGHAIVNNKLYFGADSVGKGHELWVTDGTPEGTKMVKDIYPGQYNSSPENITAFGNKVIFSADSAGKGREPWISDGTSDGTFMLADIYPAGVNINNSSAPRNFIEFQGRMYFSAKEVGRNEVWVTDGTSAGTFRFTNINTETEAGPGHFCVFNDKLWFVASTTEGIGIWNTDGTEAGTAQFMLMYSHSLTPINGKMYFISNVASGLWVTDGTVANTNDLPPIGGYSQKMVLGFIQAENQMFITASYIDNVGIELYKLDTPQAIKESETNNKEILFPNPASEMISVKNLAANFNQTLSISDMKGNLIMQSIKPAGQAQFDIAINDLKPGMYILSSGNYSWKFIKR
jgi:ELWxxDGT repeat protein